MRSAKLLLLIITVAFCLPALAQVSLNQYHIAVGNSSNQLSGSSALQYNAGQLTMGSTSDNYLSFTNQAGWSHIQSDVDGNFVWWTPLNGTKKMTLTNSGQLKLGSYYVNGSNAGAIYKIQVDGGAYFTDLLSTDKIVNNAKLATNIYSYGTTNTYTVQDTGNISTTAYHGAQINQVKMMSGNSGTVVIPGLQSSVQSNEFYMNKATHSDAGAGQMWSVQTNTFYPGGAVTIDKMANTYMRTHLEGTNSINTYYSLFMESPFGAGNVSQISNYYGIYQESSAAKNYFAGKVAIGTSDMSGNDFKLFVETGIRTRKVKVDIDSWADYVFEKNYKLPTLTEVEQYIAANKHLPGVASAEQVKKEGVDLGDNQAVLLKKIEELTLYVIDLQKQINELKNNKSSN